MVQLDEADPQRDCASFVRSWLGKLAGDRAEDGREGCAVVLDGVYQL